MREHCECIGMKAALTQEQNEGEQQNEVSAFRMIRVVLTGRCVCVFIRACSFVSIAIRGYDEMALSFAAKPHTTERWWVMAFTLCNHIPLHYCGRVGALGLFSPSRSGSAVIANHGNH